VRGREQLELTPSEYLDAKAAERQRHLAWLVRELRLARAERRGWYVWVSEVWPRPGWREETAGLPYEPRVRRRA
jgi:hypothetical protein